MIGAHLVWLGDFDRPSGRHGGKAIALTYRDMSHMDGHHPTVSPPNTTHALRFVAKPDHGIGCEPWRSRRQPKPSRALIGAPHKEAIQAAVP